MHPLYLEALVKGIQQGADIAVCDFKEVYDGEAFENLDIEGIDLSIVDSYSALVDILHQKFHDVAAWGILLPLALSQKYPFPEGKIFEDLYTTYQYFIDTKTVSLVREPVYYYYQRVGSIMSIRNNSFIHDLIEASDLLVEHCVQYGSLLEEAARNKQFSNYCRLIVQAPNLQSQYSREYNHIVNRLRRIGLSILFGKQSRLKNRMAAFVLLGGVNCLKLVFRLGQSLKQNK